MIDGIIPPSVEFQIRDISTELYCISITLISCVVQLNMQLSCNNAIEQHATLQLKMKERQTAEGIRSSKSEEAHATGEVVIVA